MPVIPLKLTDQFVRAAFDADCPPELILLTRDALSAHPTAGRRLIGLYDEPLTLPGSGWYQNSHHHTVEGRPLDFDTLHLHIAYNVQGRLVGFMPHTGNVVRFLAREQLAQLREAGRAIAGQAYLEEDY